MVKQTQLICLLGPTESGKTQLAIELVQRLPCKIISVDSAMIYRGMDIGTAKPGPDQLAIAPHRLIDICDPVERYSVAQFCQDALMEIEDVCKQGAIPLLVGGTMLYFRALQQGLSKLPAADPSIRAQLESEAAQGASLYARLAKVDPLSAKRIKPNDKQRIQRALEVYLLTGKTLTENWCNAAQQQLPYHFFNIALIPQDRAVLHQRIKQRFQQMLDKGFIAEVEQLYQRDDLNPGLSSMRSVGYRQVWQYLAGELSYQTMIDKSVIATRQVAKRQLTWLRSWPDIHYLDAYQLGQVEKVLSLVNGAVAN